MQRFEWSHKGLLPRLSDTLIQCKNCPKPVEKSAKTDDKPTMSEPTTDPGDQRTLPEVKTIVKDDNSNQHIWDRVNRFADDVRLKIGKLLSYLAIEISKNLLDFADSGVVSFRGKVIPGTDIISILNSIVSHSDIKHIGEILILTILAHAPPGLVKFITKSKLAFVKNEERDAGFVPFLQGKLNDDKALANAKASEGTMHVKHNPQLQLNYVSKKAVTNGRQQLEPTKTNNVRERAWYEFS